jgi:hypothetical protein
MAQSSSPHTPVTPFSGAPALMDGGALCHPHPIALPDALPLSLGGGYSLNADILAAFGMDDGPSGPKRRNR